MNAEKQKTILLVEDEAIIAMAEKMTLEKFGYRVLAVHHGEDAVTAVAKTPAIDLILMDIDLGKGMDGTEAAALILKERDLPVVFLSSHMEPEIVAKTEKITSYGYVVKNSSITVLDASIKMAFKLFEAKVSEKKKEDALRQSEEILRYIVKHDPNAIAVYDRGLHYLAVSDRYLKDYNVREADIIGRHHYDVFPEIPQKWKDVHQRCLAGAIERDEDDHFERPDGSITYNRWECRPWHRVDGEIGGIITYTEVTTERKLAEIKLAQSHDLLTKLARLVPGVIYQYRLDPDGRSAFPYASPGIIDIYEVTPEEVRDDATPVFARLHPDDYDMVAGAIQASALTLTTFYCEFRVLLPRQGLRWRGSQAHPERLADGGILWHGIISDITERKLGEEALRKSEEQFRTLGTMAPIGIYLTDTRGHCRYANPRWCEMAGLTLDEALGDGWTRGLHPDDREAVFAAWEKTVESEGRWGLEYRFQTGEGKITWVQGLATAQRDAQGKIIGYVGANIDITQRKLAEQALRHSEERWRDILFSMADWVWEVNKKGVYTYSSEKGEALLGHSREQILGKTPFDFMPPEEAKRVGAIFAGIIAKKGIIRDLENWNIGKNGERLCLLTNGVPILDETGNLKGYRGVDKDITERKRAEEVIQNTLRFQQALMDAVPSPIFYKDANCVYMGGNKAFERYIGLAREQFIGKTVYDIAPADLAEKYDQADKELLKNQGMQTYEVSVAHADGTRHEVVFHKAVFSNVEGHLAGLIGVILDITERKQAQSALQENNSRLELAMQAADMAWWEMDLASGHVSFEKRKAEMLGYPAEKFEHYRDFVALIHPDDREKAMAAMRGHLDGSLPRYEVDYRIATSSGAYVWFHDIGSIGDRDLHGKPLNVTGLVINISGRKQAEAEIQRQLTEKEILLREVHHRIKNNIASIGGLLSLHMQALTSPEAVAALQDAIGRVDSMRLLYEKLLLSGDFQDASTKNYIESLATSVVSLFPDLAKVKLNLDVDDFKLDPKRLFPLGIIINELLTNIMKYAFAGKKSGTIKLSLAKDSARVTLTLQDNGAGLPTGFDIGASKGFGLTLVKMLSQQLGGSFSIEKHKGTRCRLVFNI
jgi:PAS domain S-box-containing protein